MIDDSDTSRPLIWVLLIVVGIAMIIASWTPIGRVASLALWTSEDSAAYSKLRQELHRSAYRSPARAGLTQAEMQAQQEKMEQQAKSIRKKLERARAQPRRWSHILFWMGALLTALGGLWHRTASP